MRSTLTWTQARRVALRAQGLGRVRHAQQPSRRSSRAALERTISRIHLLQIDSVNVFARAHHLPVFTRHGSWDATVLDDALRPGPRRLVREAIAHEATYSSLRVYDLLEFRRRAAAQKDWAAIRGAAVDARRLLPVILRAFDELGPASASQVSRHLGDTARGEGWGWRRTTSQWAVEYLFRSGALDCVGRSDQFERLFVPSSSAPEIAGGVENTPETRSGSGADPEAVRELVALAAQALGIAEEGSLADYFRLPVRLVRTALAELRRRGVVTDVAVSFPEGERTMLLHVDAPAPRAVRTSALVSPFDPTVFHRPRLQRLFDVDYRIGIYTPAHLRTTGYYSLLFLLGDIFPARVDLKAHRSSGVLEVRGVHREPLPRIPCTRRPADEVVAMALAAELRRAASWQGLTEVQVTTHDGAGEIASHLARATAQLPSAVGEG